MSTLALACRDTRTSPETKTACFTDWCSTENQSQVTGSRPSKTQKQMISSAIHGANHQIQSLTHRLRDKRTPPFPSLPSSLPPCRQTCDILTVYTSTIRHIRKNTCSHIRLICLSVSVYLSVCLSVCASVCLSVCPDTYMYACMHACMHACTYISTYICIYVCLNVCI